MGAGHKHPSYQGKATLSRPSRSRNPIGWSVLFRGGFGRGPSPPGSDPSGRNAPGRESRGTTKNVCQFFARFLHRRRGRLLFERLAGHISQLPHALSGPLGVFEDGRNRARRAAHGLCHRGVRGARASVELRYEGVDLYSFFGHGFRNFPHGCGYDIRYRGKDGKWQTATPTPTSTGGNAPTW